MAGQVVLRKVAAFPRHRHLGKKPSIRPLGTILSTRTISPGDSSTLQNREGQGYSLPGPSRNKFPSDPRFFSLIIVARASCVDLAGSLGFQKDLNHTLPMCAGPHMSCRGTRCLRRVCSQSDAKAAHPISQKLSSRTLLSSS